MQHPPDLRDFLLQSSDEEDVGVFEMSDPQLDSEAEVMAYFYKNQTNSAQQAGSDESSQKYSRSFLLHTFTDNCVFLLFI